MSLHPYDITRLAVGPARVLYAPISVAVPTKLQDIIKLVGSYDPVEDWVDFGAAVEGEPPSYRRGFEAEGQNIEQETSAIFEEITDVNRGFSLNVAEIDPDSIKIVEGTEIETETIAAGKETSAQKRVPVGTVAELPQYRVALIGQRRKEAGIVKEPTTEFERGRLICAVLNRCSLAADDSEVEVAKGGLLSAPISFEAFPEPGEDPEEAHGGWLFEDAGVIPAV